MKKQEILIALGLLILALAGRFLPHLPDATPLTAVFIGSALYLRQKWAILVPLLAVFFSDFFLGSYDWRMMACVYGSWAFIGILSLFIKKYPGAISVGIMTISSSLLFFLTTNFAVWAFSPWYAKSLAGLMYCYEMGVPFLRNMMIGDLIYVPLMVGVLAAFRSPARLRSYFASYAR